MYKIKFKYMRNLLLFVFIFFVTNQLFSQPYVFIDTDTKGLIQSNATWVDVNKDGYVDLILTGERYSSNMQIVTTNLYINDKKGNFVKKNSGIHNFYRSSVSRADMDKDGDLDLLITGETDQHSIITRLYRNNGWGGFTTINPGIIGVRDGCLDIGDYNNDGKQDVVISGENNGTVRTKIYRGINSSQFVDIKSDIVQLYNGSVEWGDYDKDRDLDLLICGEDAGGVAITKIYQNTGNDGFSDLPVNMLGLRLGEAIWGDFDGDKDLDVFVCGESNSYHLLSRFYRNDGSGEFKELIPAILGVRSGNIQAEDFDCDGDLDLLVSGESVLGPVTKIYRNDGDFYFTDITTGLPGVYLGGAYWADYDNDCDKDLFIIGLDHCYDFEAKLYRSDVEIDIDIKKPAPINNKLWIQTDISFAERLPYYYFVWSSCYCDPQGKEWGTKDYHMYISNIHYIKRTYELQERFNSIIINSIPEWGQVNGGHRVSIGYKTREEAEKGRQQVIKDYIEERFKINYINW